MQQERVDAELGIPVKLQRCWTWAKRHNGTVRLNRPLSACEEGLSTAHDLAKPLDGCSLLRLFIEAPVLEKVSKETLLCGRCLVELLHAVTFLIILGCFLASCFLSELTTGCVRVYA